MVRTKSNGTGHLDTVRDLAPAEVIAIGRLLAGDTHQAAADAAGVARSTLYVWLQDPVFAAALEAERQKLWAENTDALRSLMADAVQVVRESLKSDDQRVRLQAAMHLLARSGIFSTSGIQPVGPSTPAAVETARERAALRDLLF